MFFGSNVSYHAARVPMLSAVDCADTEQLLWGLTVPPAALLRYGTLG